MSYARQGRAAYPRRTDSEEEDHLTSPLPSASFNNNRSSSPLSPPRPFFVGRGPGDRGSWSDGTDAGSEEEDRDNVNVSPTRNNAGIGARRISAGANRRQSWGLNDLPDPTQSRQRNHHRRGSSGIAQPQAQLPATYVDTDLAPSPTSADPFKTGSSPPPPPPSSNGAHSSKSNSSGSNANGKERDHGEGWTPVALYRDARESYAPVRNNSNPNNNAPGLQDFSAYPPSRPTVVAPPSSYPFPFQSYPGNPDPGTVIPGVTSRRSSMESLHGAVMGAGTAAAAGGYQSVSTRAGGSQQDLPVEDLGRPYAPFMAHEGGGGERGGSPRGSTYGLYREELPGGIPRTNSVTTFRAPFLSPSSRPTSSVWTPPAYTYAAPGMSQVSLPSFPALKGKAPLPSTRLEEKLTKEDKPWMGKKEGWGRASWWITIIGMAIGLGGAAVLCWRGYAGVQKLTDSQLCIVLDEEFGGDLDTTNTWNYDVELGGFGNGEFQMTTDSSTNIYTQNGELYIMPTLTRDAIGGQDNIFSGSGYQLNDCSSQNSSDCNVTPGGGTVINPVQSARINTQGKVSIAYGKVEVRAKLPTGDWLWPAIWMLPEDNTYGEWPLSGEIDIMEARGNSPTYSAQGSNYVRSSLNYGPLLSLQHTLFGWQSDKRSSYADGFHTYGLEWDENFMRFYMDTRLLSMLDLSLNKKGQSFWDRGGFPATAQNGSATEVVVENPWVNSGPSAPFDQEFYLIMDLAAGGTSGWFPDNVGGKPWYDASGSAMFDFAYATDTWSSTWPSSADDRAFRIDSVKMWKLC